MSVDEADGRVRPLLRLWKVYKSFIEDRTAGNGGNDRAKDISYWQEQLFTHLIIYSFPVCLIALLPGMYLWIQNGHLGIALFELLVACATLSIAVNTKIRLLHRKIFVVLMFYCIAILLIAFLGSMGPGSMYLLAIGIFVPLILPLYMAYWSIAINLLICIGFGAIIHFRLLDIPIINQYGLDTFIGVFTNSIFLNLVCVFLISNILNGLENALLSGLFLQKELQKEGAEKILSNERLKESEEHYTRLFFLSPLPMWVLDGTTLQFLQVNESAIRNYGYTNDEFLTMTVKDIKVEEELEYVEDDIDRSIKNGAPVSIFAKHIRKNKEQFYAEVIFNAIPFRGKSGVLVIADDISAQVDYIKAIEIQNEKLREIAWIQSHKVRSPLATILGLADLLSEDLPDTEFKEALHGLRLTAQKLDLVIRETSDNASIYDVSDAYPTHIKKLFPDQFNIAYRSY